MGCSEIAFLRAKAPAGITGVTCSPRACLPARRSAPSRGKQLPSKPRCRRGPPPPPNSSWAGCGRETGPGPLPISGWSPVPCAAGCRHPAPRPWPCRGSAGARGWRGNPRPQSPLGTTGRVTLPRGTASGLQFSHLRLLNLFHNEEIKSCSKPKSACLQQRGGCKQSHPIAHPSAPHSSILSYKRKPRLSFREPECPKPLPTAAVP